MRPAPFFLSSSLSFFPFLKKIKTGRIFTRTKGEKKLREKFIIVSLFLFTASLYSTSSGAAGVATVVNLAAYLEIESAPFGTAAPAVAATSTPVPRSLAPPSEKAATMAARPTSPADTA